MAHVFVETPSKIFLAGAEYSLNAINPLLIKEELILASVIFLSRSLQVRIWVFGLIVLTHLRLDYLYEPVFC